MDWSALLILVLGLGVLVAGAELLVRGASRLAVAFGVSPLVVGLTVVAFGTSAPEVAVSAGAALSGQGDVAVGNVIGSNVFNVLFILGLSAVIAPLVVTQRLVRIDVPLLVVLSVLVLLLGLDGEIGRFEGVLLLAGIVVYTIFAVVTGRRESAAVVAEYAEAQAAPTRRRPLADLLFVAAGLGLLILGARWFVGGAVDLARGFGVSELVIGLTIVAAGTSLPEVATSVTASLRGERDIAVGNVVGSNIFNLLAVLGVAGVLAPDGLRVAESVLRLDLPVMVAVAVACLPVFFTGHRIDRWEGGSFLVLYVTYVALLVLTARSAPEADLLRRGLLFVAGPLVAITLGVAVRRQFRSR